MILHHAPATGLRLDEAADLRKFKVVLAGAANARPALDGITFVDDDNALVRVDLVPTLPGAPADADWRAGYEAMVAAAARHGWIDAATGGIRAHVERVP